MSDADGPAKGRSNAQCHVDPRGERAVRHLPAQGLLLKARAEVPGRAPLPPPLEALAAYM